MSSESSAALPTPASVGSLIRKRRSIKPMLFGERRIQDELVSQMLENATWAPTHGRTEPWRFFVFCDEARNTLGERLAEIYGRITPTDVFRPEKADRLVQSAVRSSHVIAFAMKRQASEKIPEIEEIEAVACAIQNLHLTATAHGVGGYWSSGKAICSAEFRDWLRLDVKDRVLGLFYLGYPAGPWPDGVRASASEKVHWIRVPAHGLACPLDLPTEMGHDR